MLQHRIKRSLHSSTVGTGFSSSTSLTRRSNTGTYMFACPLLIRDRIVALVPWTLSLVESHSCRKGAGSVNAKLSERVGKEEEE